MPPILLAILLPVRPAPATEMHRVLRIVKKLEGLKKHRVTKKAKDIPLHLMTE